MKPCIVLDSNVWINNLLLRSPISLALIYGVVQKGAKIAIPDVVGKEIFIHTEKRGLEILDKTLKNIKDLSLFYDGSKKAIDKLPDKGKISEALQNRLGELDKILLRHKHTFSEMQQALEMVINKLTPNFKDNQQYKDSLIWQAVLSLSNNYLVHFVTRDKGFFKNREYKEGPAQNILKDIESKDNNIFIYSELESCVEFLQVSKKQIDKEAIIDNIFLIAKDYMDKISVWERYTLKDLEDGQLKQFITDDPDKIVLKFTIKCSVNFNEDYKPEANMKILSDLSDFLKLKDPRVLFLEFNGHCLFSIEKNKIIDLEFINIWEENELGIGSGYLTHSIWPKNGLHIFGEIYD